MGVSTLVTFQVFYLIDQLRIPLERVATLVAVSTLVHYVFVFAASPIGGWLSDRLDRRKIFITVAAGLYAVGLAVIAFADSFPVFLVGMAVTGIGEGAYLAVDLALVTDVLPNPDEAAKEMAVFNVATALPPQWHRRWLRSSSPSPSSARGRAATTWRCSSSPRSSLHSVRWPSGRSDRHGEPRPVGNRQPTARASIRRRCAGHDRVTRCRHVIAACATAVCACIESPLGHSLTPAFLQVGSPGCLAVGAAEALVIPARDFARRMSPRAARRSGRPPRGPCRGGRAGRR